MAITREVKRRDSSTNVASGYQQLEIYIESAMPSRGTLAESTTDESQITTYSVFQPRCRYIFWGLTSLCHIHELIAQSCMHAKENPLGERGRRGCVWHYIVAPNSEESLRRVFVKHHSYTCSWIDRLTSKKLAVGYLHLDILIQGKKGSNERPDSCDGVKAALWDGRV